MPDTHPFYILLETSGRYTNFLKVTSVDIYAQESARHSIHFINSPKTAQERIFIKSQTNLNKMSNNSEESARSSIQFVCIIDMCALNMMCVYHEHVCTRYHVCVSMTMCTQHEIMTQHDSTWLNMTQHDSTWLNMTQHDSTWLNMKCPYAYRLWASPKPPHNY